MHNIPIPYVWSTYTSPTSFSNFNLATENTYNTHKMIVSTYRLHTVIRRYGLDSVQGLYELFTYTTVYFYVYKYVGLFYFGPKCTLAASHAAPGESQLICRRDRQTDGRTQAITLRFSLWTSPRIFAWTVSSELLGFWFYFFLIFSFLCRAQD